MACDKGCCRHTVEVKEAATFAEAKESAREQFYNWTMLSSRTGFRGFYPTFYEFENLDYRPLNR